MQTFHEAVGAVETFSPAEEQFNRRRRTAGLFLAPAVFLILLFAPLGDLPVLAHRMAAIMGLVVILWITEALPLAITAILGPCLAVVLGITTGRAALAPFADPIIFLFIGGFMLAQAMFVHGVDRRIAYGALAMPGVGTQRLPHPARLRRGLHGAVDVDQQYRHHRDDVSDRLVDHRAPVAHVGRTRRMVRRYALAMMLITSFGPSIGGMGTPVGTPPNLIGIGMLEKIVGQQISFFSWMAHRRADRARAVRAICSSQFYWTSVRGL